MVWISRIFLYDTKSSQSQDPLMDIKNDITKNRVQNGATNEPFQITKDLHDISKSKFDGTPSTWYTYLGKTKNTLILLHSCVSIPQQQVPVLLQYE
jgi:hypothetical protein